MGVRRGYDRQALDAQYNLRARHPEHPEHFRRWAAASAAARASLECRLDLSYGPGARQRLDIFPAAAGRPAPVLAFIHGGYWQSLDKADFSFLAAEFVAAGITFAAIGYELAPRATMDAIVAQIRAALAWLFREGAEHGADPQRIFVCGHSAGGHLTAMALSEGWAAANGLPADLVKVGCALSGLYDLEPIRLCYLNDVLGMDAAEAARNSPAALSPARSARLILAVGGEETKEFLRQQAMLAEAWQAKGAAIDIVEMPGRDHFTIVDALARREDPLFRAVARMTVGG